MTLYLAAVPCQNGRPKGSHQIMGDLYRRLGVYSWQLVNCGVYLSTLVFTNHVLVLGKLHNKSESHAAAKHKIRLSNVEAILI